MIREDIIHREQVKTRGQMAQVGREEAVERMCCELEIVWERPPA